MEEKAVGNGEEAPLPNSKNEAGTWIKIADMEIFVEPGKDINKVIEKYLKYLRRKRSDMKLTKYLPGKQNPEKVHYTSYKIHGGVKID